jgi:hypothetical protein
MLAIIGFTIAAVCFAAFAYTFQRFVVKKTGLHFGQFSLAYYALALAFLSWAVAAGIGTPQVLAASVLWGDVLFLLGALCLLHLYLMPRWRVPGLALVGLIGFALIYIRAMYLPPEPYMSQGILVFNIPTPVALVLALFILAVWLPISAYVARHVTAAIEQPTLSTSYTAVYVGAALSALLFISARRPLIVALSFSALVVSFALLITSNAFVKTVKGAHGKSQ